MEDFLKQVKNRFKRGFGRSDDKSQGIQAFARGPVAFTAQEVAKKLTSSQPPVLSGSDLPRTKAGEYVDTKEPWQQITPCPTQLIPRYSAGVTTAQFIGKDSQPAKEPNGKQSYDRSTELWNDAYDKLEAEVETANVADAYRETLAERLADEEFEKLKVADIATNSSTAKAKVDPAVRKDIKDKILYDLKDRTHRLEYMARFVREVRASKTTERVGGVANAILTAKPLAEIVLQVPQAAPAALPWAGVCLGLEILANPAKARKSNLDGISTVCSRLDWYSSLCYSLLNGNHIKSPDENVSIKSVQEQLEERVLVFP